jgi:hypothetical protein
MPEDGGLSQESLGSIGQDSVTVNSIRRDQAMSHHQEQSTLADVGLTSEALSSEVLKLKIDDLFHDLEALKERVSRLERRQGFDDQSGPWGAAPFMGVFSDPDSPGR